MIKRLFDITTATTALVALSPVYVITAYKVKKNLGSPVLFRQTRPGLGGKPFEMIKFRTMKDGIDSAGNPLPDSKRLTDFGKMLRSTSLDELPGLWNVVKGDMSLVGPRPLLMEYLPLYNEEQKRRHNVRPGITGYAQVNGRNAIGWDKKFALDTWYVDNQSLWLDVKILLKTVKKVLIRDGISADGEATMSAFSGNGNLYLLGAGGLAREIYSYLSGSNFIYDNSKLVGFLNDGSSALDGFNLSHKIIGNLRSTDLKSTDRLIVAVADPALKEQIFDFYNKNNGTIISYKHPSAIIGHDTDIGAGTVFAPYSIAATNVKIGRCCTVNAFSSIGHDAVLGDFCTLSGHCDVTGNVKLGDKVFMGSHASVIPRVQVGNNAVIGAGSLVIRRVKENTTMFGNPAKKIF